MGKPNFVQFKRSSARIVASEPMLSIQKHGTVSFNAATYEALGKPEAVIVLWDPDEGIFAFRASEATDPDAYTVQKQPAARSFLVNTQSFFRLAGLDVSVARRFAGHDYGDGVIGLKLDEGAEVSTTMGRGKQAALDEMLVERASEVSRKSVPDRPRRPEGTAWGAFGPPKDSG